LLLDVEPEKESAMQKVREKMDRFGRSAVPQQCLQC